MAEVDFSPYIAPFRGGRAGSLVLARGGGATDPGGGPDLRRRQRRRRRCACSRPSSTSATAGSAWSWSPPTCSTGYRPSSTPTSRSTSSPCRPRRRSGGCGRAAPCRCCRAATRTWPACAARTGRCPATWRIVQVSPPGPEGKVSLGVVVGANVHPARTAPLVIAQVNPQVPYTFGAGELPVEEIDLLVEVDEPIIIARPAGAADPVGQAIAARAAAFVGGRVDHPVRGGRAAGRHPRPAVRPARAAGALGAGQRGVRRPLRGRLHRGARW